MQNGRLIRIAAAGDIHASEATREQVGSAFASLGAAVDLVLLAGDLTTCGDPEDAVVLADACRGSAIPICAVLGNHDWHLNRTHEVVSVLTDAGVRVLERSSVRFVVRGQQVGVVGLKGFVGGFPDQVLPDFGEPLLRQVYAETTEDVTALERELRGIWAFLGSDRLAGPIAKHSPDLVLHGHAHAGTFEGFIGRVPVHNVATHVTGKDFWIFELGVEERPRVERPAEARAE